MKSRLLASNFNKTVGALVWLCLGALTSSLSAQTNNPAPIFPSNRFLLIIETSHGMALRAEAMRQSVQGLLNSAMAAQAHRGDTLGIWTFNEELHTGGIPLQKWAPEDKQAISDRLDGFLKAQNFENHARFDKIMPAVDRLTRRSQFITVILVCMGETDIQGTPFDARINEFFRTWRAQKQDAGTPFVIALRGQAGRFVDCTMNPSPWPVELPALPKELLTPIKPVPPSSVAHTSKPAAVTSSVPPLIISGRKRDTAPASTTRPDQTALQATTGSIPTNTAVAPTTSPTPSALQQPLTTTAAPTSLASSLTSTSAATTLAQPASTKSDTTSNVSAESKPEPHDNSPHQANQPEARWDSDHDKPVQAATAVPVNRSLYVALLGFTGLVSIGAIVGAIWFWRLRAQRGNETSLITESLDRPKK